MRSGGRWMADKYSGIGCVDEQIDVDSFICRYGDAVDPCRTCDMRSLDCS